MQWNLRHKQANHKDQNELLDLLTRTYGEKLRLQQDRDDRIRQAQELAERLERAERNLKRCFESIPKSKQDVILDSYPGTNI